MADDDDVVHTEAMDQDLVENYLDCVQRKQTEEDGIASHGRLYDPIHHHKLPTYWDAARNAHTAVVNGMRKYDSDGFSKWKPSKQLFRLMKAELAARKMPPFTPRGPVLRRKSQP